VSAGVAMSEEANMIVAKMRIEEIKSFYVHAGIYVVVNILLILINVLSEDEVWWSLWTVLGWGLGLLIHSMCVFGPVSMIMMKWEQRKIAQLMHKD
jgi:cell division protein FtsW (lipid II flippase)